jgi:UDP-N-acetylglucosamine--N-acetylmuramyl-(pentapeptide) pyrophosphoryl-undecaprenol N-acetylglucosamine transferase
MGNDRDTHEQTLVPGLANRLIAKFASLVLVSFEETARVFGRSRVIVAGLPLRSGLFKKPTSPTISIDQRKPILYITGGSNGSVSLNTLIYPIVSRLIETFSIVHQVGKLDLHRGQDVRENLPKEFQDRYIVIPFLDGNDYTWVLSHALIVIGRSGANTVGELAALGKVSIFIPLPWSGGGEQEANARYVEKHGGNVTLDQETLTSDRLFLVIYESVNRMRDLQNRADNFAKTISRDGAARIVSFLMRLLSHA